MDKTKLSRALFILVAVVAPIFIGVVHTYAHFKDLMQPHVDAILNKEIDVMGTPQVLMDTLGVVSFMMGASFIAIGILNVAWLKNTHTIAPLVYFAMGFYQLAVIYVGVNFDQAFQLYGGIFGLIVLVASFILSNKE